MGVDGRQLSCHAEAEEEKGIFFIFFSGCLFQKRKGEKSKVEYAHTWQSSSGHERKIIVPWGHFPILENEIKLRNIFFAYNLDLDAQESFSPP